MKSHERAWMLAELAEQRRVFVAGASGAVGRPLCQMLVQDGWTVYGTTRSQEKAELLRNLGVEPVIADVFDEATLTEHVVRVGPVVVIHQLTDLPPGLEPARMAEARDRNARVRELGTRNLVAAASASGVERFIAQSIAFIYAPGPKPYREDDLLDLENPNLAVTGRAVASLEAQVLAAPFHGMVLRYGKFYGPRTGFDAAPAGGPVHVQAAADAARRAATRGEPGIYNIAEDDGTVSTEKAASLLGWDSSFRLEPSSQSSV